MSRGFYFYTLSTRCSKHTLPSTHSLALLPSPSLLLFPPHPHPPHTFPSLFCHPPASFESKSSNNNQKYRPGKSMAVTDLSLQFPHTYKDHMQYRKNNKNVILHSSKIQCNKTNNIAGITLIM